MKTQNSISENFFWGTILINTILKAKKLKFYGSS